MPATNQANVAQVDTYNLDSLTVENNDSLSLTIDAGGGNVVVSTGNLGAGATVAQIATAFNTAIGASALNGLVSASDGGGNRLLITANSTNGGNFTSGNLTTTTGAGNTTPNDNVTAAQIDRLSVNLGANPVNVGDVISIDINGTAGISYTAIGGDTTAAQLATGLANAINASAQNGNVTADASAGDGTLTITSDTAGTAVTLANNTFTPAGGAGQTLGSVNIQANDPAGQQIDTLNYRSANWVTASTLQFDIAGVTRTTGVIAAGATSATVRDAINAQLGGLGITAQVAGNGNDIEFVADVAGTPFANLSNIVTQGLSSTTSTAQQQRQTVSIGADSTAAGGGQIAVGDQYSITLNGNTFTATASAGQSATDLANSLITDINNSAAVNTVMTASLGGAGQVVVESDIAGRAYTLGTSSNLSADSFSSNTTTANVSPFSVTKSLQQLSEMLAHNGGEQSQLLTARRQLQGNQFNFEQANSRIRDVDIAAESASLARARIRLQAVQGLISQANIATEAVLRLLQ